MCEEQELTAPQIDEQIVRAAWVYVGILRPKYRSWLESRIEAGSGGQTAKIIGRGINKAAAWSAARQFTEERKEEIRQLENDVCWIEDQMRKLSHQDESLDDVEPIRILARLQAALAELKRGMKGEA